MNTKLILSEDSFSVITPPVVKWTFRQSVRALLGIEFMVHVQPLIKGCDSYVTRLFIWSFLYSAKNKSVNIMTWNLWMAKAALQCRLSMVVRGGSLLRGFTNTYVWSHTSRFSCDIPGCDIPGVTLPLNYLFYTYSNIVQYIDHGIYDGICCTTFRLPW